MTVNFSNDHESKNLTSTEDSQLFVAITGTRTHILAKLKEMVTMCEGSYGKPWQGVHVETHGTTDIITPIWGGKKF